MAIIRPTLEQVQDAVLNVARYDIDKLRQALIEGDPARCARLLEGLKGEGAAPPLVLWAMALWALSQVSAAERMPLILGSTWRTCPFNIAALSVPAFVAGFWALKGAAPTRLVWTGAGAGLLAGALGALVYALHCPEMATPFLAVWYVAGMAIPTALGAVLGPRLLRW